MPVSPVRVAVVAATLLAAGALVYLGSPDRWRSELDDRLLYGVPWGTVVTATLVVAFYLVVQGGARNWGDPLVLPFVTWSYFYPTGMLTAGIAHGGPNHLISNVVGTLAIAPIVEYAWSHYPRDRPLDEEWHEVAADGGIDRRPPGLLARPWVRAVVVFPAAVFVVAFLTSLFSLGPSLGFSGAVFALLGFAVVTYPMATVVGVVVASALGTLFMAVGQPVVVATVEVQTPGPPGWAGIAFQAHALGFLIGVLLGVALLWQRRRRPSVERAFVGVFLVGMVQSLWLIAWPLGEDTYGLYRGHGVAFVLVLTIVLAVAISGSRRPLPRPLSEISGVPTRRAVAIVWIIFLVASVVLAAVAALVAEIPAFVVIAPAVVLALLLAIPAVPPLLPAEWTGGPLTTRQAAVVLVVALTVLVAAPSVLYGLMVVDEGTVPGSGGVEVGDYTVTYEENATSGQTPAVNLGDDGLFQSQTDGLIVVSDERELWTLGSRAIVLEFEGEDEVVVGGIGWRETVHAERTGWDVVGNDSAYAVDLEVDGERTRSFTTDPVVAGSQVDGFDLAVRPTDDGFDVEVREDGSVVDATSIPEVGESADVGAFEIVSEGDGEGATRLYAETDDARVLIAERETY